MPSHTFLRCGDYLKFLMGLGKIFTKICAQLHVFFAVETNLSFWWDLEKFSQKSVPSYTFLRCGDYLFWGDLESFDKKMCPVTRFFRDYLDGKNFQVFDKKCAQLHVFSLWRLSWVFDGTWKNFDTKKCAQLHVFSLWRLTWVFDGTWKNFHKKCAQLHVSSLWRLSWVFDGTWKNFHKKVVPSYTRFFARCGDYLKFLMGLGKIFTKKCAQLHVFFAVETILSFWWDLEKFSQKVCPVTRFFAVETNLSFWWDLEKFSQKSVPSTRFSSLWRLS